MSDIMKICPICGIEPIENGVNIRELFCRYSWDINTQVCVYPGGSYTMLFCNEEDDGEGSAEIPLNFCPECGRDLRRKDVKRGEWIDTGDGGTHCSECGYNSKYDISPFCPECGAKMEPDEAAK